MRSTPPPKFVLTVVVAATVLVVPSIAYATITPTSSAGAIAGAIASPSAPPGSSSFVEVPGTGTPNGTSDSMLAGFPTEGATFAILTTGDVNLADEENSATNSGANLGSTARGAFDVSILKVDLTVPANQNCLRVDFRFLSEEYPEFVGGTYNDGFIAELDTSDWSVAGATVTAPKNFAFDQSGNVISVNDTGVAGMSPAEAVGTTYDGGTPLLTAQTPITTAGPHSVYFSVFDAGDHIYDSAVFLDNLALGATTEGGCQAGAFVSNVNLSIDKTDAPDPVTAGTALRYTLNVANSGTTDATNVQVVDQLPSGATFTAASGPGWTCTPGAGTVTCTRPMIAATSSAPWIDIDVRAPAAAGTINNVADVSSTESDTDPANNHDEEPTTVLAANAPDQDATFCKSGCTLSTNTGNGATPADPTVTLEHVPNNADAQAVSIVEQPSSAFPGFCGGVNCTGQVVTLSDVSGVTNNRNPIIVALTFDKTVGGTTQLYIKKDASPATLIPKCTKFYIASPHPCVSTTFKLPNGDRVFVVLLLSGDPILGKR